VACSGAHTFREVPTLNADSRRTNLNRHAGARSTRELLVALRTRLPEKRRKDAVLCLEYLVTASPSFFAGGNERSDYFRESLKWIRERHAKENVLCAAVHLDETSPHLVVYVVPLTADGRLAAKDFVGGASKLSRLQTDFHKNVGMPFGLIRGAKGSKARHQRVSAFYSALKMTPRLPAVGPVDHIAAACGIDTKKMTARRVAEDALQVRASSAGRQALGVVEQRLGAAIERGDRHVERANQAEARLTDALTRQARVESDLRVEAQHLGQELQRVRGELAVARKEIAGWVARFQELAARFGGLFKRDRPDGFTSDRQRTMKHDC